MPQLDFFAYNSIVILTLIIFFSLLYLVKYFFLPVIAQALKLRHSLDITLTSIISGNKNLKASSNMIQPTLQSINAFLIIVITQIKNLWQN